MIIEVTSSRTRVNDVETKLRDYAWAGVPYYVIADAAEEKTEKTSTPDRRSGKFRNVSAWVARTSC